MRLGKTLVDWHWLLALQIWAYLSHALLAAVSCKVLGPTPNHLLPQVQWTDCLLAFLNLHSKVCVQAAAWVSLWNPWEGQQFCWFFLFFFSATTAAWALQAVCCSQTEMSSSARCSGHGSFTLRLTWTSLCIQKLCLEHLGNGGKLKLNGYFVQTSLG